MEFYFYFSQEISVDKSFTEKKIFFFFSPFLCLASFYGSLTSRRLVSDGKSGYKVVGTGKPTFSFAIYCESLFSCRWGTLCPVPVLHFLRWPFGCPQGSHAITCFHCAGLFRPAHPICGELRHLRAKLRRPLFAEWRSSAIYGVTAAGHVRRPIIRRSAAPGGDDPSRQQPGLPRE